MAGTNVPGSFVACTLAAVRSREVGTLIDGLERARRTGRPGYGSRALIGVCIARSVYGFPTWTRTTRLVAEHAALRRALGAAPSANAVYRFTRKLRGSRLLRACLDRLVRELARRRPGFGRDLAIDSTDLPTYANGQKYKYRGGPEREVDGVKSRSDPATRVGIRPREPCWAAGHVAPSPESCLRLGEGAARKARVATVLLRGALWAGPGTARIGGGRQTTLSGLGLQAVGAGLAWHVALIGLAGTAPTQKRLKARRPRRPLGRGATPPLRRAPNPDRGRPP